MSTDNAHDKSPDGPVAACEHCGEPREQWRTNRYATHLASCTAIDSTDQRTIREFGGES